MERIRKRPEYIDYQTAFDTFTTWRKELNDCATKMPESFAQMFGAVKFMGANEDSIAMDVVAYFYKSGIPGLLDENYMRYIRWEVAAASRGNQFAIEKLQFLIGYACDMIANCSDYEVIAYKNDIDENNALYVIGKNLCKILARDFLNAFPIDLAGEEDEARPYSKEDFFNLRKMIDDAVEKTIAVMKS